MAYAELALRPEQLLGLSAAGLKLSGLSQTRWLAPASRFEGPTSVLAEVAPYAFLDVGAFCNLSGGSLNNLVTGRYCSIANDVVIGAHEHPTDWLTTSRTAHFPEVNGWDRLMAGEDAAAIRARTPPYAGSCPVTRLGSDVWIGQGAFIKAGVSIGSGAIIGARSVVVRDVPPYAIVVGTPGRVVRLRFPEPIVARLLALEWWRFSIYDLFDAPFDRIEQALEVIEAKVAGGALRPHAGPLVTAADLADPAWTIGTPTGSPIARAS